MNRVQGHELMSEATVVSADVSRVLYLRVRLDDSEYKTTPNDTPWLRAAAYWMRTGTAQLTVQPSSGRTRLWPRGWEAGC